MLAHELENALWTKQQDYENAIRLGELGKALIVRDELGKLAIAEMPLLLEVLGFYCDQSDAASNAGDDNVPDPHPDGLQMEPP